jgi:hypothetical protein
MSIQDALGLFVAVIASVGGVAAIVVGVSKWLGDFWAKKLLQTHSASLQAEIEKLRHELSLSKASYDHRLDLILDYYALFYRHYRLCQRTASADAHRRLPDGPVIYTKDEFLDAIDQFIVDWPLQEGRIRLLLPSPLLALHEEVVECFNKFKGAVDKFSQDHEASRKDKEKAFEAVENVKIRLEAGLTAFLRTEKLLEWKSDF